MLEMTVRKVQQVHKGQLVQMVHRDQRDHKALRVPMVSKVL